MEAINISVKKFSIQTLSGFSSGIVSGVVVEEIMGKVTKEVPFKSCFKMENNHRVILSDVGNLPRSYLLAIINQIFFEIAKQNQVAFA